MVRSMKVVFLGTGGAGAPPGRAQNSILVEGENQRLLLDAGPGSGQRLREYGLSACSINHVLISHLHLDHWAGLFDIAVQAAARGCKPPQIIIETRLFNDFKEKILPLLPRLYRLGEGLILPVESNRIYNLGEFVLELSPTSHTVLSFATSIKLAAGRRLVYTSDTRFHQEIVEFCNGAKLVITEATLPSSLGDVALESGHQTVSDVFKYLNFVGDNTLLAIVHLTEESFSEISRISLPVNIIVPSDFTIITL